MFKVSSSKIHVVDVDAIRRLQVCRALARSDMQAAPFDGLAQFAQSEPDDGFILAPDDRETLAALVAHVTRTSCLPIVAYSRTPTTLRVVRAMQAGAASYLPLPLRGDDALAEFRLIEAALPAALAKRRRAACARALLERLSRRERQILVCMLDHGTSKAIAQHLAISPRTVEAHRANMMIRLGVETTNQAIRIALEGDIGASIPAVVPVGGSPEGNGGADYDPLAGPIPILGEAPGGMGSSGFTERKRNISAG